jgi:hypothetical protein
MPIRKGSERLRLLGWSLSLGALLPLEPVAATQYGTSCCHGR